MTELPNLDFTDQPSLMDWLSKLLKGSHHVLFDFKKGEPERIVEIFAAHGYRSGVFMNDEADPDDMDKMARCIIGQCLKSFEEGQLPMEVSQAFIAKWQQKFL